MLCNKKKKKKKTLWKLEKKRLKCVTRQTPFHLGEVHLGFPPHTESLRGENVGDNTEQHQKDGHRHHYHIMANAAREGKGNKFVKLTWKGEACDRGSKFMRARLCHLLKDFKLKEWVTNTPATLCQCPTSSHSPSPGRKNAEERKEG